MPSADKFATKPFYDVSPIYQAFMPYGERTLPALICKEIPAFAGMTFSHYHPYVIPEGRQRY